MNGWITDCYISLAWSANEIVMATARGLFLWTRSPMTKEDAPHIFRELKDNELWQWGF